MSNGGRSSNGGSDTSGHASGGAVSTTVASVGTEGGIATISFEDSLVPAGGGDGGDSGGGNGGVGSVVARSDPEAAV
jgi:hypothetical protein